MTSGTSAAVDDVFDDLRPELVFGLIGPIGSDLDDVQAQVINQLSRFGYRGITIKITAGMLRLQHPYWRDLPTHLPADRRYQLYMDAGNKLRQVMRRRDAMGMVAVQMIREERQNTLKKRQEVRKTGASLLPDNRGYVVESLKTPEEVDLLRTIYGDRFLAIAAHTPLDTRRSRLAHLIADSHHRQKGDDFIPLASQLILRDQQELDNRWGQNVADAFPKADIFLNTTDVESISRELHRAFDLLFGHPFISPTPDELAMALASRASLRSADISRQIGAAITLSPARTVISLGCNEVPSVHGQYWPGDSSDDRDFQRGVDTSFKKRRTVLADTIRSLLETNWVPPDTNPTTIPKAPASGASDDEYQKYEARLIEIVDEQVNRLLADSDDQAEKRLQRRLLVEDLIEFNRTVHAEMAAILDAARRGVSVEGGTLYSTTFPCHECARHIIAAGIREVQYIEPYPKSLVGEFYPQSIELDGPNRSSSTQVVFRSFVGIAPRRFDEFFAITSRKDGKGKLAEWRESAAHPREDLFGIPHVDPNVDTHARRSERNAVDYREIEATREFDSEFLAKTKSMTAKELGGQ